MQVLTAAQSRALDRWAIEELGIPSLVLMENAALAVVELLLERAPAAERIAILCGPGNNGGDGLAVARHLAARGFELAVGILGTEEGLSPDGAAQLRMFRAVAGSSAVDLDFWPTEAAVDVWFEALAPVDLVVDALFGTGLSRPLAGTAALVVQRAEELDRPVLAVDLPSGLDADQPEPIGPCLPARWTVTFETPKLSHLLPPADRLVGDLAVGSLGLPRLGRPETDRSVEWMTAADIGLRLPRRDREGHKGTFGHLWVVAGSPGHSGAAILAARAAVHAGAGLVTVATPQPCADLVELGSIESMTLALPSSASGHLALEAVPRLLAQASASALAVGPGLGRGSEVGECVRRLAVGLERPLVLDADALFAFAGRAEALQERPAATVLTPHPKELARLFLGSNVPIRSTERLEAVREAARRTGCVVVLKGYRTLVAEPEGRVAISSTGNHGLASGGSGDVLTGIVGAFLAAGLDPWDAACAGVFLHGQAADLFVEQAAPESLSAGGLVDWLSAAYRVVREAASP